MQPVQNITVDDRVSRTQYQYTLEDPDPDELNLWTNRFRRSSCSKLPELEDVATRPANGRPGSFPGHRSPDRVASWHRAGHDRQHAIRRFWPATDQHHVYAGESISRDSGDASRSFSLIPISCNKLYIQVDSRAAPPARRRFYLVLVDSFHVRRLQCAHDDRALHSRSANTLSPPGQRADSPDVDHEHPARALRRQAATSSRQVNAVPLQRVLAFHDRPAKRYRSLIKDSFPPSRYLSTWRQTLPG